MAAIARMSWQVKKSRTAELLGVCWGYYVLQPVVVPFMLLILLREFPNSGKLQHSVGDHLPSRLGHCKCGSFLNRTMLLLGVTQEGSHSYQCEI